MAAFAADADDEDAGSKLFEENFREIIRKMSEDSEDYNPFRLTKEEIASLDPNYKKPKKRKVNMCSSTETFFGKQNSSYNTNCKVFFEQCLAFLLL